MAEIIDFQLEKIKRQSRETIKAMVGLIDEFIDSDNNDVIDVERQVRHIKTTDKTIVLAL